MHPDVLRFVGSIFKILKSNLSKPEKQKEIKKIMDEKRRD